MFLPEPLFCPCCAPAIAAALVPANLPHLSQQMLFLGKGAFSAALGQVAAPRDQTSSEAQDAEADEE
jgi:hypothetical protein